MTREEFYQQALLRMADVILSRTDKEPTPEQLAKKAGALAEALCDEMDAGMTRLDIARERAPAAPPPAAPKGGVPTLFPTRMKKPPEPVEESPECPTCGGSMKKRKGQYGVFWGCASYPHCRGVVTIGEES